MAKDLVKIDLNGTVSSIEKNTDQYNYEPIYSDQSLQEFLIDSQISTLPYNIIVSGGIGFTIPSQILINPYTEQVLSGQVFGDFQVNEQAFQSTVTPQIINRVVIGGATATEYAPTIGTVGASGPFLGVRAAQFKGSYLDLNEPGAGIQLPPFNFSDGKYFSVEGFVYFQSFPNTYDPILISRGIDGVGGTTHDSFSIEYNRSDRYLAAKYNFKGWTAPGFDGYTILSPQDGVTLNKWHHFAFVIDSGTTSGEIRVAGFFDGQRTDVAAVATSGDGYTRENIRPSIAPITIGCGASGERPFKGWMDSIIISGSSFSSDALRGYNPLASGITVPSFKEPSAGNHTIYSLNMNGPVGTSLFPCDTSAKLVSTVSFLSPANSKVGVALISKQNTSPIGITAFTGVCYGHSVSNGSAGYLFGYNSGACMVVSGVEQLHGITRARQIRSSAAEHTISYLLGSTAMNGICGASKDFTDFFSANWGGNTFSYLATQTNTLNLRFIYDSITISGRTGVFYIKDFDSNTVYGVQTADIKNLYADVVEYHAVSSKIGVSASARMQGITTMQDLYNSKGFEDEAIVQKVAPNIDKVGILFINTNGRVTKSTSFPEREYSPRTIEGIIK